MKRVNSFSMSMKINSSGLVVIGIFQKNQLKDKYVTSKMENV